MSKVIKSIFKPKKPKQQALPAPVAAPAPAAAEPKVEQRSVTDTDRARRSRKPRKRGSLLDNEKTLLG